MQLRYTVVRIVPDPIRDEPINVGVILQSDTLVQGKFIEKIPKDWGLPMDLQDDVAPRLNDVWAKRLSQPFETVYIEEQHTHVQLAHTDKAFLEWLRITHTRHLQMAEVRDAEINVGDAFGFETFLYHLYGVYVAPKPRLKKPIEKGRLHSSVKRGFAQLHLPPDKQIRERDVIIGSFPWVVNFVYAIPANGHERREVGIGLVDFTSPHFIDRAKDLVGTWADVKQVRKDVTRISVVGNLSGIDEQKKAVSMLKSFSDDVFVFDQESDRLFDRVANDFQAITGGFTREVMQEALRKVSRRTPA